MEDMIPVPVCFLFLFRVLVPVPLPVPVLVPVPVPVLGDELALPEQKNRSFRVVFKFTELFLWALIIK
jgi:hypothetical protein